ncbi:MAG TPA: hypothetical protein VMI31_13295 [Fimbriimonadaceae bacterium]|nr:hypothetical protein [Fimbriimonadaceae bacterium]
MRSQEQTARAWLRAGSCRYEFDVRKRPGESARVVINCLSPTGNCSRISIDEEDWPAFAAAFAEANEAMTTHGLVVL